MKTLHTQLKQRYNHTLKIPVNQASPRILNLSVNDTIPFTKNLHNNQTTYLKIKAITQNPDTQTIIIAGNPV